MQITIDVWAIPLAFTVICFVVALCPWPSDRGDWLGIVAFLRFVAAVVLTLIAWLVYFAVT
jgi:hypothetical protein